MPDLSDLSLTFDDEFNSFINSPNGSQGWQTTLPHNLRTLASNQELQYYSDPSVGASPFSVQDGVLDITASAASNPAGLPYVSGVIITEHSFSQLYGYFEMRAELPLGQGMWPAFWMLPTNLSSTREIDVLEMFGDNPTVYDATDHSPGDGTVQANIATPDLTLGFHNYGVYWTPTSTSFYFDGALVANMPTPSDMNVPMFMLANLAIAGNISPTTTLPAHMLIDDIRAYAYNPNDPGPTPLLTVAVPPAVAGTTDQAIPLNGVAVSDSDSTGSGQVIVNVSDKSLGLLSTVPVSQVTTTGEDSWHLKLVGTAQAVNAALATLAYENVPTSAVTPTQDTVTVAAVDASNNMDAQRIALSLGPGPTLQFVQVGPQPTRYMASGNSSDVFILDADQIADPQTNSGQADHIINFISAAQHLTRSDFLALHGFDPSATLVFDHNADVNGVKDQSMQYYHVASVTGNSPIFLVQMSSGATAHLTSQDYGFYPT